MRDLLVPGVMAVVVGWRIIPAMLRRRRDDRIWQLHMEKRRAYERQTAYYRRAMGGDEEEVTRW